MAAVVTALVANHSTAIALTVVVVVMFSGLEYVGEPEVGIEPSVV